MKKTLLILSLLIIGFLPIISFAQDQKLPTLKAPDLKVSIPGMSKLQNITCTESGTCNIPWLGQYIGGIQRYAIGVVGIIAVIVLMIGGIIWLTAAGNSSQITQAKKMIGGSFFGLLLVFGSYLILYMVNPNLTKMKSLEVSYIKNIPLTYSLTKEEIEESRKAVHLPYGTSFPINSVSINNNDSKNVFTNYSFLNPYKYIKINTALAGFFNPPDFIPLIQQTNQLVRDHDYSTEDGEACQCPEEKGTTNIKCTNMIKTEKFIARRVQHPEEKTEASTIETSGCGIAALNMVMAAYEFIGSQPDDLFALADITGQNNEWRKCYEGTKIDGLKAVARQYGMVAEELKNVSEVENLIKNNYPIMLSVGPLSGCTTLGHWIVVHGKINGKYIVKNPYQKKDENAYCQKSIDSITTGVNRYLFVHPKGECIAEWNSQCRNDCDCCSGLKCVNHGDHKKCQSCIPLWEWESNNLPCCS